MYVFILLFIVCFDSKPVSKLLCLCLYSKSSHLCFIAFVLFFPLATPPNISPKEPQYWAELSQLDTPSTLCLSTFGCYLNAPSARGAAVSVRHLSPALQPQNRRILKKLVHL